MHHVFRPTIGLDRWAQCANHLPNYRRAATYWILEVSPVNLKFAFKVHDLNLFVGFVIKLDPLLVAQVNVLKLLAG